MFEGELPRRKLDLSIENTSRALMWRRNIHTHWSCSDNNPATKNQIATTIWIADVIAIPPTTFH
jgi:hypothetical protein